MFEAQEKLVTFAPRKQWKRVTVYMFTYTVGLFKKIVMGSILELEKIKQIDV